jgi:hypothetical protein
LGPSSSQCRELGIWRHMVNQMLTEHESARLRFRAFRAGYLAEQLEGGAERAEQFGHLDRAKEFRALAAQDRAEQADYLAKAGLGNG